MYDDSFADTPTSDGESIALYGWFHTHCTDAQLLQ